MLIECMQIKLDIPVPAEFDRKVCAAQRDPCTAGESIHKGHCKDSERKTTASALDFNSSICTRSCRVQDETTNR